MSNLKTMALNQADYDSEVAELQGQIIQAWGELTGRTIQVRTEYEYAKLTRAQRRSGDFWNQRDWNCLDCLSEEIDRIYEMGMGSDY